MCCTHPCQDQITDLYIWSNTDDGVTITPTVRSLGIQQQHIVLDRDYFLSEKGGSTGFTYPHPLQGDSTWVRDGTDPSDSTITPGGAATKINAFTTSVTEGSDTLTAITATFATGTHLGVDLVELLDSGDDQLATVSDPSSEHITFTGLSESVTTTPTSYTFRITLHSHADMPAVPGDTYLVTLRATGGTATQWVSSSDVAGTVITIDNESPDDSFFVICNRPASEQLTLTWINSNTPDFSNNVILRRAGAAVTDAPTVTLPPKTRPS